MAEPEISEGNLRPFYEPEIYKNNRPFYKILGGRRPPSQKFYKITLKVAEPDDYPKDNHQATLRRDQQIPRKQGDFWPSQIGR